MMVISSVWWLYRKCRLHKNINIATGVTIGQPPPFLGASYIQLGTIRSQGVRVRDAARAGFQERPVVIDKEGGGVHDDV